MISTTMRLMQIAKSVLDLLAAAVAAQSSVHDFQ